MVELLYSLCVCATSTQRLLTTRRPRVSFTLETGISKRMRPRCSMPSIPSTSQRDIKGEKNGGFYFEFVNNTFNGVESILNIKKYIFTCLTHFLAHYFLNLQLEPTNISLLVFSLNKQIPIKKNISYPVHFPFLPSIPRWPQVRTR